MSRKDAAVKESALHIYDAQKRPERTFASFVGKSVPGKKEPLHRPVDRKKHDENRDKSTSTKEGSTKGDNRFSVRLIDGKDNRKGGDRVNELYTLDRIPDGDPFYVKITDWTGSSMALLTDQSVTATPGRGVLEVYDAEAYLGDSAALDAAEQQVVAGNGYHLYLLSLQPAIPAHITIRIWDTVPEARTDAEGHIPVSIESVTGILVVSQLEFGPAGEIPLPRPGVYEGRAWWSDRQAAADYYNSYLEQDIEDWTSEQTRDYLTQCPAKERYVLDLAYTGDPEPLGEHETDH